MKKRIAIMMLAAAMTFNLAACGGSSKPSETTAASQEAGKESGDYKISVCLKTLSAEYWTFVKTGCMQAGADLGVKVDVKGPTSETAFDEQQNMIETDLNSDYDAFIISPLQADTVATLIKGQTKPVIALDTDVDAPEVLTFVGTGNEAAAAMGAKAAVESAKEAGWSDITAICLSGVQGDGTATARFNGYKSGVEEAGGTFLADETQYADAVADKAVNSMEAIMQNHPEGIAIICCNNDDMAIAAARAAKGNEAYAKTVFLGFNGDKQACEAILAGELTMSVAQEAYSMGYMSVEKAVDALNGKTLEDFTDSGCDIVTPENAQERLDTLNGYLGK